MVSVDDLLVLPETFSSSTLGLVSRHVNAVYQTLSLPTLFCAVGVWLLSGDLLPLRLVVLPCCFAYSLSSYLGERLPRQRPCYARACGHAANTECCRGRRCHSSFPSGSVMTAVAVASAMCMFFGEREWCPASWSVILVCVCALLALHRMSDGQNHAGDIAVAVVLGVCIGSVCYRLHAPPDVEHVVLAAVSGALVLDATYRAVS